MAESVWTHILLKTRTRPGALAVQGPVGAMSYQALVRDVDALSTELLERGLTGETTVGVQMAPSYLHLLMLLALDRLSIPSVSISPTALPPAILAQTRGCGLAVIFSTVAAPVDPPCPWITVPDQDRPKFGGIDRDRLDRLDQPADGLVRIMWSSGTTGGSKGIAFARVHQMLRLTIAQMVREMSPRTRHYMAMPLTTGYGYRALLSTLIAGGTVVLPDPDVDFILMANALRVTTLCVNPMALTQLVGNARASGRRLETVEALEVGGASVTSEMARDARTWLTPNVWTYYGSSEAGIVAVADAALCVTSPGTAGFVIPWIEVEAVDAADNPLAPGREGALRMRGAPIATSYYRAPHLDPLNFRDGWFYPGDVGSIDAQGLMRVTGRAEDVIRRDGEEIAPLPIEEFIQALPGVRDVAVFPVPRADGTQEACAAVVLVPGTGADQILAGARAGLGTHAPTRLIEVAELPRNDGGKVLKRQLVEHALRSRTGTGPGRGG